MGVQMSFSYMCVCVCVDTPDIIDKGQPHPTFLTSHHSQWQFKCIMPPCDVKSMDSSDPAGAQMAN